MANKKQKPLSKDYTVDAVYVPHGRYVRRIVDNVWPLFYKEECNICGFAGDALVFKFCPNCGAKMEI